MAQDHPSALKTAVVLCNLGTPAAPTVSAVKHYLNEFLSDPRVVQIPRLVWRPLLRGFIAPRRAVASAKLYQHIWQESGSPLLHHSNTLATQLHNALASRTSDVQVFAAMRYGQPSLTALLQHLRQTPVKQLIIVPMYPQYASATTGSTLELVYRSLAPQRYQPSLHTLHSYHDHPSYIKALAATVRGHWAQQGRSQLLLMSFHGIPERSLSQGDPYACLCQKTARLLAAALELDTTAYRVVFQSRFGKARWLQPYCSQTLAALPQEGIKSVDIVCPGFAVDCLETLEEIAIRNRQIFLDHGGSYYHYIPCLNATTAQVQLYCDLITPLLG